MIPPKSFFKNLSFFSLLLFFCAPALNAAPVRDAHTEVELVADAAAVSPGSSFRAGVIFRLDPEWHVYWKNPGDSGMTPKIEWVLSEGITAGETEWPAPVKIDLPPLSSYAYEHEVLLAAPFQSAASVTGPVILKAKLQWLACKIECVPGKADLELTLPAERISRINSETIEIFSRTRFRLPIKETGWQASAVKLQDRIVLQIHPEAPFSKISSLFFFAENPELVKHAEPQPFSKIPDGYKLEIPVSINAPKDLPRLKGLLVTPDGWRGAGSETAWEIDISFSSAAAGEKKPLTLFTSLLFAFLGGLILNLMPCVLPVLSLKILSFVREASEDPRRIFKHGLIFTAGVVASFWVLAALLVIFQTTGRQIGWGFQLQSPLFVGFLSVVFIVFAFNLFGFFEIGASLTGTGSKVIRKGGALGAFASGALATVVATPCTAPFMGTALGFALTQPPLTVWAVFTSLALGMAAPYLLLCANPKWLRFVPKPGMWMIRMKQFLGVLMLLTAFWLLWILGLQTGISQKVFRDATGEHSIAWEPYSEKRLNELRAANKAVFVDFTAAWCLTCQVNERVALETPKVAGKFKALNIAALKADWTNQDPEITRALAGYGRSSIPFYVLYGNTAGARPVFLPEILTPSVVLKAFQDAGLQKDTD